MTFKSTRTHSRLKTRTGFINTKQTVHAAHGAFLTDYPFYIQQEDFLE